ncbi:MAG: hypothetical protein MR510_00660 [Clostridium sp.]|jgi:uncharacterized protein eag|uniref:hypothetical protein n=1 Tax=Clostridium sp. TaxID=1506 RepID=UPI0025C09FDC|nr:hypothetical protein [Clostridium sp.]MCI6690990.1 hypothetical protein [Clostridium sp.]MDY2631129.1 hypothetical protein [Clostridium sp.]MDY4251855.1 hypothetical protein [Clostridium sp.]MDY6227872.1 hypothetical protein [Clostridium sp.]
MVEILKLVASFINDLHDKVLDIVSIAGYELNDKQLHFIFMALIGIVIFAFTQIIFKKLSKYSITAISFIYTLTVMVVIVFAIEIQQKITNRGNMEFADIAYGLYGFLYIFLVYLLFKFILLAIKMLYKKYSQQCKRIK